MARQYLLEKIKGLRTKVHPVELIKEATPLHNLSSFARAYNQPQLLIKREDQTDSVYGGNKVRNLEYVLGEAIHQNYAQVSTLIPYGSNFSGALAAQAKKLNLRAELSQFVLQRNPQIEAHVEFGRKHGARMTTFKSPLGFAGASAHAAYQRYLNCSYFISPGASNILGALGHANAFLEMIEQMKSSHAKKPEHVVVGAGTCGTLAGLMVGALLNGGDVTITGVRCAEPLVCNRRRVASLVNQTLRFLGYRRTIVAQDVHLVESPGHTGYAKTNPEIEPIIEEFKSLEGLRLDVTYTAKVMIFLKAALRQNHFRHQNVMYWHTFSPAALQSSPLGGV